MPAFEPYVCDVSLSQLDDAEEFAFAMLHMDRETVMDQFDDIYEDSLEACNETLSCKAIWQGFEVESVEDDCIRLSGGGVLESTFLARVLHRADEIVMYATTIHGFDELMKNCGDDPLDSLFYNAWGVGFSMSAHRWLKENLANQAHEKGLFASRGWVPGEDELELSLQGALFELIDPAQIGISLDANGLMRPMMSVSGFMGICADSAIETDGSEYASCH